MDKEALEKLKEYSEVQDRSISYLINAILREHYDLGKKKPVENNTIIQIQRECNGKRYFNNAKLIPFKDSIWL